MLRYKHCPVLFSQQFDCRPPQSFQNQTNKRSGPVGDSAGLGK
jgi:hypothetical protein